MSFMGKIWMDGMKMYDKCVYHLILGEKCDRVLDLGCGNGAYTIKTTSQLSSRVIVGVEGNEEKLKEAASRGLKVLCCDLNKTFPFANASFDMVFCNFVIEHLFDIDNFILEIKRVLKDGGCAIIGTENLASTHNFLALVLGMQPFPMTIALSSKYRLGNRLQAKNLLPINNEESPHVRVFAYEGLKDIFSVYSFDIEKICGAGYPPLLGWISRIFAKIDPRHAAFNLIKVRKGK